MKKTMILAVALAASVAGASELWWTVNSTGVDSEKWNNARVYYFNDDDKSLAGQYGTPLEGVASASALEILDYAASTLPNRELSAYSFYVELYNSETYNSSTDHSDAYRSEAVAYNDLLGSIYKGGTSYGASPYAFSNFSAQVIPEPTSGVLVLLGMMALGLKRKRV